MRYSEPRSFRLAVSKNGSLQALERLNFVVKFSSSVCFFCLTFPDEAGAVTRHEIHKFTRFQVPFVGGRLSTVPLRNRSVRHLSCHENLK